MARNTHQDGNLQGGSGIFVEVAAMVLCLFLACFTLRAQSTESGATPAAGARTSQASSASAAASTRARARRRAARRRQRLAQEQQAAQQQQGASTQVGPTAAQRARDAQILAAQKAQSNAIASENDALTQKVIEEQQRQQAEPRIQDAPGPDSTPLPGEPAVMPASSSEPPRIQDAPGPAQTLPKAPPAPASSPATTPAPAPEQ